MNLERIPSGIGGFDELVEGGLIKGDMHLLAGAAGTGKTIFASSFVYNAVSKQGLRAVYATFEESPEYFKRNMKKLGMDLGQLEKSGNLKIIDLDALKGKELEANIQLILTAAEESESSLLVIDSLTALLLSCETRFETRTFMKAMYKTFKSKGITTLLTASLQPATGFGVEGFVSDSVMQLEHVEGQTELRTRFIILKMRGTDHSRRYHSVIYHPAFSISKY